MDLILNDQNFRVLRFCVREYPSFTQMEEDINIVGSNPGKDFSTNDLMNALDYFNSLTNALLIVETINLDYPKATSGFERILARRNNVVSFRSKVFDLIQNTLSNNKK
ncbi:MAG: hypothetical protein ACTHMD_01180 [Flavisolibacter sp.]